MTRFQIAHVKKTLDSRIKRVIKEIESADNPILQNKLMIYIEKLQSQKNSLNMKTVDSVGDWCRENHGKHLELCPSSLERTYPEIPGEDQIISAPVNLK